MVNIYNNTKYVFLVYEHYFPTLTLHLKMASVASKYKHIGVTFL